MKNRVQTRQTDDKRKDNRSYKFQLCLNEEEWNRLSAIARSEGLSKSDLVRYKTLYREKEIPTRTDPIKSQVYRLLTQQTTWLEKAQDSLNADADTKTDLLRFLKENLKLLKELRRLLAHLD